MRIFSVFYELDVYGTWSRLGYLSKIDWKPSKICIVTQSLFEIIQ